MSPWLQDKVADTAYVITLYRIVLALKHSTPHPKKKCALRIAYYIRSPLCFRFYRSVDEAENNLRNMSEEDGHLPGILIN